jgi:hypothetical protein
MCIKCGKLKNCTMKKTKKEKYYNFIFPLTLTGIGKTADEAWEDAVSQFIQDPGSTPNEFKKEEVEL